MSAKCTWQGCFCTCIVLISFIHTNLCACFNFCLSAQWRLLHFYIGRREVFPDLHARLGSWSFKVKWTEALHTRVVCLSNWVSINVSNSMSTLDWLVSKMGPNFELFKSTSLFSWRTQDWLKIPVIQLNQKAVQTSLLLFSAFHNSPLELTDALCSYWRLWTIDALLWPLDELLECSTKPFLAAH